MLYLGSALEGLRGTFFRQAMFADFEREVHAASDRGESLTRREHDPMLRRDPAAAYHGDAQAW
jgi:oligoendopeptidase F